MIALSNKLDKVIGRESSKRYLKSDHIGDKIMTGWDSYGTRKK